MWSEGTALRQARHGEEDKMGAHIGEKGTWFTLKRAEGVVVGSALYIGKGMILLLLTW